MICNVREKHGSDLGASSLGCKLHRALMSEVGEEMCQCQAEVAHHANKSPEYFVSRPEKHVSFYKKALALSVDPQVLESASVPYMHDEEFSEGDDDGQLPVAAQSSMKEPRKIKRIHLTPPSDLALYERRTLLWFATDSGISHASAQRHAGGAGTRSKSRSV